MDRRLVVLGLACLAVTVAGSTVRFPGCPGQSFGNACYLTEPEQVVSAIDSVLDGSICTRNYVVAPDLYAQVTTNASFTGQDFLLYPEATPQDWFTNHTGIESVLNSYCCGIPGSFDRPSGAARSACLCFMGFGVAFPISADGLGEIGYVIAKAIKTAHPVTTLKAYERGRMDVLDFTKENFPAIVRASLEYTFVTADSGIGVSWAGPGAAKRKATLPCELQEAVLDEAWDGLQKAGHLCELIDQEPRLVSEFGCSPCQPLQVSGAGGGDAGCWASTLQKFVDVPSLATEICSSAAVLRAFLNAFNQFSVLFNTPDVSLSACGQSQVAPMPNFRYNMLRDGEAQASMWKATDSTVNPYWHNPANKDFTCNALFANRPGFQKYAPKGSCTCAPGSPGQRGTYGGVVDFDPCRSVGETLTGAWSEFPQTDCRRGRAWSLRRPVASGTLTTCMRLCRDHKDCATVVRKANDQADAVGDCYLYGVVDPTSCSPTDDQTVANQFNTWQLKWVRHEGRNCYVGSGGSLVPGRSDPLFKKASLDQCQSACESAPACNAVVVEANSRFGFCWLRLGVDPQTRKCKSDSAYVTWILN